MQDKETHNIRWNYYIDRKFQNQFMLRFSLVIILIGACSLLAFPIIKMNQFEFFPGGALVGLEAKACPNDINEQCIVKTTGPYDAFDLWWPPIAIMTLVNLAIVTVFGLFYSHSMAGPIHRMKSALRALAEGGEAKPVSVRKGDQFQDLVDLLNEVIEKRVK